ncbi:uncharacterized protein EV420DRAFT_1618813 [Desarmillaria tabescens]|uniref:Late embryogenesis abundant protein LEA-2 subgroup domain-containing protein n=1 Tax=Armillaria tabescens TaxID=1929756 RepID=A0AA39TZP3_ARMTA|nr:uncharacterized protein EV420DRAFT_1618813 [Desarmillaria tabescens]KAK0463995.1 hypothetical protein EV420DRAFT_1618813 [Desarmillaria tabescens]
MAYRDPYAAQYGRYEHDAQYTQPDFNPYGHQQPCYLRRGDEPTDARGPHRQATMKSHITTDSIDSPTAPTRVPQTLKSYRYETQGNLWTRGGRPRCIGRFCCCTLLIAVFLIISIILSLHWLWIRPPNVSIGELQTMSSGGSEFELTNDGVNINLGNISVDNPNYFSVNLKKVTAELFYPLNSSSTGTDIGGGTSSNINFASHSQTNFTFPFAIEYTTADDPNSAILVDLLEKYNGEPSLSAVLQCLIIVFQLAIRILIVTVSPVISNSFSFACPLDSSSLSDLTVFHPGSHGQFWPKPDQYRRILGGS